MGRRAARKKCARCSGTNRTRYRATTRRNRPGRWRRPKANLLPHAPGDRLDFGAALAGAHAIQRLLAPAIDFTSEAHVDTAAADRRAGDNLAAERIIADLLEALGPGLEEKRPAGLAGGVNRIADEYRRGGERAVQPLLPHLLA